MTFKEIMVEFKLNKNSQKIFEIHINESFQTEAKRSFAPLALKYANLKNFSQKQKKCRKKNGVKKNFVCPNIKLGYKYKN